MAPGKAGPGLYFVPAAASPKTVMKNCRQRRRYGDGVMH